MVARSASRPRAVRWSPLCGVAAGAAFCKDVILTSLTVESFVRQSYASEEAYRGRMEQVNVFPADEFFGEDEGKSAAIALESHPSRALMGVYKGDGGCDTRWNVRQSVGRGAAVESTFLSLLMHVLSTAHPAPADSPDGASNGAALPS